VRAVGSDPSTAAVVLTRRLRALGTPDRAAASARYLKVDLEHLGVTVPDNRRVVRRVVGLRSGITHDELLGLVRELWRAPIFDTRLAAVLTLEARPDLVAVGDLPLLRTLAAETGTWALLDPLATNVLGRLIVSHPNAAAELDGWVSDPSFWVRRAALLSQLRPLKAGADFDRFARYADAMLEEREFFIRKAIGWVLREHGKTHPEVVVAWLGPRRSRVSAVTLREAIKYVPEDAKGALGAPLDDTDVRKARRR
jgi:3-methyladenine DNA glycosylase AlkD